MKKLLVLLLAACAGAGPADRDAGAPLVTNGGVAAGLGLLTPTQRSKMALVASPPLAQYAVPFGDSSGYLAQDPGFYFTLNAQGVGQHDLIISSNNNRATPTDIGGSLFLYNTQTTGDDIVGIGMDTAQWGTVADGNHGYQLGFHSTGLSGDRPGVLGGHIVVRENMRLYGELSGNPAWQMVWGEDAKAYLTAFDGDSGATGTDDGKFNLGRYTEAGVGGASYTRKLRLDTIRIKNAISWGGGAGTTLASEPELKDSSGTLAVRNSGDSADGALSCGAFTSTGSTVVGSPTLLTGATSGFLYIPGGSGAPTGVPASQSGHYALYWDHTNHKLYIYDGAWLGGTTPGTFN